jgi:hypothetical protein
MFRESHAFIVWMTTPTQREPIADLVARLAEVQAWKTGRLRAELERLTGIPSRSWNRPYLIRKVSWLIQQEARQASDTVDVPTLVTEVRDQPRSPRLDAPIQVLPGRGGRDPRLPRPGTEIVRVYRGLKLTIRALEKGYEWNGLTYSSLTAVARAITGQHWNGPLFFNLRRRSRGPK